MVEEATCIDENKGCVDSQVANLSLCNPVFQQPINAMEAPKKESDQVFNEFGKETLGAPDQLELLSKWNIWKNLMIISFGFLFTFSVFFAMSNIQSSLNSEQGLGTISLSVTNAAQILSSIFVSVALIKGFGCKWTMVISMFMFFPYIAANFYATWYTMIPASILVGIAAAPLWAAKCTYVTEIGHQYAKIIGESPDTVIARFFGVIFMIFECGQVFGNLISSLSLAPAIKHESFIRDMDKCGANYCNEDIIEKTFYNASSNSTVIFTAQPTMLQIYLLCGIFLGFTLFGCILISLFVSPLKQHMTVSKEVTGFKLMLVTLRHMRNSNQILLIPITILNGLQHAFLAGDFTKAFVTCAMGIDIIGFTMICYSIVNGLSSIAFGSLMKLLGRPFIYGFVAILNFAFLITILHWKPDPSTPIVLFLLFGIFGMVHAIWINQIQALYSVLFRNNTEAAFSTFRLLSSLGAGIGFLMSNNLCIGIKIYILLGILILGVIGYIIVEVTIFLTKIPDVS